MANRISEILKGEQRPRGVQPKIGEYEHRFALDQRIGSENGLGDYKEVNDLYYDLVTDFFEYGWGRSFHFAPRVPGESFKASLIRHERYLAEKLEIHPGMVVADIGCGVGGPMMEIARYSGARVVGVNSNAYQLEHARKYAEEAGLTHLAEFINCDFLHVDAADESFDAVYSIEATCCAPDKVSIYAEIFRLLKPGGCFGAYEYCVTDRFDPQNPRHQRIKENIQLGGGLLTLDNRKTVNNALGTVGFQVLETLDLSEQSGPSIPWYRPLVGSGISFAGFRSSRFGRWATHNSLRTLEAFHIVPRGTVRVSQTLNLCATAMAEAGRLGIFTPMYFVHARKPA